MPYYTFSVLCAFAHTGLTVNARGSRIRQSKSSYGCHM